MQKCMEKFDFDTLTDRRGSGCFKWDGQPPVTPEELARLNPDAAPGWESDVIPMWVADMDFKVAPCIIKALHDRVDHGVFGYTKVMDSYLDATIEWWRRRRGWNTEREWYLQVPGIVAGMSVVIKALTQFEIGPDGEVVEKPRRGRGPAGEKPQVIIQSPAYNCFFSSVRNNGCELVENKLIYDLQGDQPTWYLDFEDLERKASDPMAKVLLLCNPHNPCGRCWPREDLERIGEICRRHGVIVLSDEIHCELEMPGCHYTPMATVSAADQDNTITMNSPTKAFNIAGLAISNIVTNNPEWRKLIDKVINLNEVCDLNVFGPVALEAAYREGQPWLDALRSYLYDNYRATLDFFEDVLPQALVTKVEATYLVWLDVRWLHMSADEIQKELIAVEHVWPCSGVIYGLDGFLRINLACPRTRLLQGLNRIAAGLERLSARKKQTH